MFAAYSLISALTDIGIDTIVEELSNASWSWVIVALVCAQLTNIGEYFSLAGVVGSPVPFGPTIMFRYALSFISLAVPADAGAIAMNIQYQRKLGVPVAAAVAQGPLLTLFSKGFDVILLLVSAKFIGEALDTEAVDLGKIVRLVCLVVVAAIVACVVVVAVPRLRAKMLPHVTAGFGAVKGSLTDPARLMKIVGGVLTQKILFALTLAASVAAFDESLAFGEAIFVNCTVSLFIGLVPVPGGIGVAEAALTAGLIAVGVPDEVAIAAGNHPPNGDCVHPARVRVVVLSMARRSRLPVTKTLRPAAEIRPQRRVDSVRRRRGRGRRRRRDRTRRENRR